MPQTGVGEDLLLLAGGVVLVLIIFAVRQARSTGTA
jgi:LPXTG-motif cell wall-anchored protein